MSPRLFIAKRRAATALGDLHRRASRETIPGWRIATFHAIDTSVDGDVNGIYNMRLATFMAQVEALAKLSLARSNLNVVPLKSNRGSGVTITFDDGYATTLTLAAPQLVQHGLPFHVYVSPALVESGDSRSLTRSQVLELSRVPGVTIGAHGYRHVPLSTIPENTRIQELTDARNWLEDVIQLPVSTMSYPFGDTPFDIENALKVAGYSSGACSIWGFNSEATNPLMLKRVDLWEGDSARTVTTKMLGHWNWIWSRSLA